MGKGKGEKAKSFMIIQLFIFLKLKKNTSERAVSLI